MTTTASIEILTPVIDLSDDDDDDDDIECRYSVTRRSGLFWFIPCMLNSNTKKTRFPLRVLFSMHVYIDYSHELSFFNESVV